MKKLILASSLLALTLSISSCGHYGRGGHDGYHKKWFEEVDANKDGFITKDEMMKYSSDKFDAIDTDKDGKICKKEMESFKEKMKKCKKKDKELKKEEPKTSK